MISSADLTQTSIAVPPGVTLGAGLSRAHTNSLEATNTPEHNAGPSDPESDILTTLAMLTANYLGALPDDTRTGWHTTGAPNVEKRSDIGAEEILLADQTHRMGAIE